MGAAFRAVGVDRNTIVVNAPMAELCIAAPETFAELERGAPRRRSSVVLHKGVKDAIEGDDSIITKIKAFKESGKLLPINKGK